MESTVGIYGKIRAERDFVRVNAGAFQRARLDGWFQDGLGHLHTEGTRLPEEPVCFVLGAPVSPPIAGVFVPGEDAVGRRFPLIIFTTLNGAALRRGLRAVPVVLSSFFEAASHLAQAARDLSTADLGAQVAALDQSLHQPSAGLDFETLLSLSSSFELRAVLGGLGEGAAYAMQTLVSACAQTRARPPHSPGHVLTLDCPAPTDGLRVLWIDLVQRRLADVAVPSFFWTPQSGRLLVTLGAAPSLVLAYLADRGHRGARLWPLWTTSTTAHQSAVQSLTPTQRQALDSTQASLANILAAFATD